MTRKMIPFEAESSLNWLDLTRALTDGHDLPRAEIADSILRRGSDTVLSRVAWIDGLGQAVKTATIFPGNSDASPINGSVSLFSDLDGTLLAYLDFHLVTKWKTAADSLLGAMRLARPDSESLLIVGAGTVAASLVEAYRAAFPHLQVSVWNRTTSRVDDLRARYPDIAHAEDLETAVKTADIVATCTMSTEPLIKGEWLRAGQHLDLIGAYRPDMREVDDAAIQKARIFMDNRAVGLDHNGELKIPLSEGVITEDDLIADFYDLSSGAFSRQSDDEVTLFKNCGGAHLDLMTCRYILEAYASP